MTADSAPVTARSLKDVVRALFLEGVQVGMEAAADMTVTGYRAILDSREQEKVESSRFFDEHWDDSDWPALVDLRALLSPPSETREIERLRAGYADLLAVAQRISAKLDHPTAQVHALDADDLRTAITRALTATQEARP